MSYLSAMPEPEISAPRSLFATMKAHAVLLLSLLGIMWVVEILDHLPFVQLDHFGIRPRSVAGLAGIVCTPFLHAGFAHLIANSFPFVILGGIVLLGGRAVFWRVTIFVTLAGGLGVWLLAGRFTNHIGASGLIFGYLGFLLAHGWFEKSLPWMIGAGVILVAYGGLLAGVLPGTAGISWQSHLFGFLAGVGSARFFLRREPELLR